MCVVSTDRFLLAQNERDFAFWQVRGVEVLCEPLRASQRQKKPRRNGEKREWCI